MEENIRMDEISFKAMIDGCIVATKHVFYVIIKPTPMCVCAYMLINAWLSKKITKP